MKKIRWAMHAIEIFGSILVGVGLAEAWVGDPEWGVGWIAIMIFGMFLNTRTMFLEVLLEMENELDGKGD